MENNFDIHQWQAKHLTKLVKEERMQAMDIERKYTEAIVDAKNALTLLQDIVQAGTLQDQDMLDEFKHTVVLLDMLEEKIRGKRERF